MKPTKELFELEYNTNEKSIADIAKQYGMSNITSYRLAKTYGIKFRSKSESQKLALEKGKAIHPTKGKIRSESVKNKIGDKRAKSWKELPEDKREELSQKAKVVWQNKPQGEKDTLFKLARKGIHKAAKEGSKLELFLCQGLADAGYTVEYHKEHVLNNQKLHLDLFLPQDNIAIEVNGLSHYEDIYGKEVLTKTQRADNEKTGLVIQSGLILIIVVGTKSSSSTNFRNLLSKLIAQIERLKRRPPTKQKRYIITGE